MSNTATQAIPGQATRDRTPETPLTSFQRTALVLHTLSITCLFYLFSAVSLLILAVTVLCELLLLIGALQLHFGMGGIVINLLHNHLQLIRLFTRSLWLNNSDEARIKLIPQSAPKLFTQLEQLCHQLHISTPREVWLLMGCTAWVRLNGYRRSSGTTILGIGYDLLAGLTVSEMDSVLAHEMVHAKLVERGLKQSMTNCLRRSASLATTLAEENQRLRRNSSSSVIAKITLSIADWLARRTAHLVAAYCRQDEFDADRGAVNLYGSESMRSALVRLPFIERNLSRIPWNERICRLQSTSSFSQWLVEAINQEAPIDATEPEASPFDKYSTHPLLQDRIKALPDIEIQREINAAPAIELLNNPDLLAEELIGEIQRAALQAEHKDSRELSKWLHKAQRQQHIAPLYRAGLFFTLGGVFFLLSLLFINFNTFPLTGLLIGLAITSLGALCLWGGLRKKEAVALPIPSYAALKKGHSNPALPTP